MVVSQISFPGARARIPRHGCRGYPRAPARRRQARAGWCWTPLMGLPRSRKSPTSMPLTAPVYLAACGRGRRLWVCTRRSCARHPAPPISRAATTACCLPERSTITMPRRQSLSGQARIHTPIAPPSATKTREARGWLPSYSRPLGGLALIAGVASLGAAQTNPDPGDARTARKVGVASRAGGAVAIGLGITIDLAGCGEKKEGSYVSWSIPPRSAPSRLSQR